MSNSEHKHKVKLCVDGAVASLSVCSTASVTWQELLDSQLSILRAHYGYLTIPDMIRYLQHEYSYLLTNEETTYDTKQSKDSSLDSTSRGSTGKLRTKKRTPPPR